MFFNYVTLSVRLAPLGARQINHPLCGYMSKVIPKNSERATIKVFKPIVERKEKYFIDYVVIKMLKLSSG